MPKVEWKAVAIEDLMAIVDYISDDNPAAALSLMDDIQTKVAQLAEHPKRRRLGVQSRHLVDRVQDESVRL